MSVYLIPFNPVKLYLCSFRLLLGLTEATELNTQTQDAFSFPPAPSLVHLLTLISPNSADTGGVFRNPRLEFKIKKLKQNASHVSIPHPAGQKRSCVRSFTCYLYFYYDSYKNTNQNQYQCGRILAGGSEMWSQLQKKTPVGASQQPGRSDFNIQHGETPPSCSQEEALRPACLKEAAGGWVSGWWRHRVLQGASSIHLLFSAFSARRDREERASRAGVSHQRRVLKEDRRLQRRQGRFSFLASARDPHSSSPTPQSVKESQALKLYFKASQHKISGSSLLLQKKRRVQTF